MALSVTSRNEIRKLTATFINSMAVGLIFIGFITPMAKFLLEDAKAISWLWTVALFVAGLILHFVARVPLTAMEET